VTTVLIVDDNEKNRKLARDVLGAAGFETLEAESGGSAISLALERLPDVVLLDLRLPDLDGTDVLRRLRADPRSSGIPVVAMSATPLDPGDDSYIAAGFAGYLEKPFDAEALPGLVRRLARR
jgi:two-component system, cell cycle response regulator DivK